jgi:hypothetical protein
MQIPSRLTLHSIESSLSAIQRAPDQEVIWPINVRNIALGGEAALVQLIITWALSSRKAILNLPVRSLNEDQVDRFVRQIHGIAAVLLCNRALDQLGVDHYERLQANGLLKLLQLDGPKPREALHSRHDFTLLCADHLGRSNPRLAYHIQSGSAPIVRDEKYFRLLTDWIFRSIVPPKYVGNLEPFDSEAIGSILHEVFENTDQHATRDIEGNILKKSIRGFFARRHWLNPNEIEQLTKGFPALRSFVESFQGATAAKKELIEISIFDSGPGLAQRLKRKPLAELTTGEEFDAVQDCFRVGVTTKTRSGHGIGLRYVIRLLQQKRGFMRLRTGRLSLFADLSLTDDRALDQTLRLEDSSGAGLQRVGRMQGTLVTFLIPLVHQ